MVIRTRLRGIILPLALYALSGSVTSYFVWHAVNGGRGLKAKDEYRQQMSQLEATLGSIRLERLQLEQRVTMMRSDAVDQDLLEEEARTTLGAVRSSDLVIFLRPAKP